MIYKMLALVSVTYSPRRTTRATMAYLTIIISLISVTASFQNTAATSLRVNIRSYYSRNNNNLRYYIENILKANECRSIIMAYCNYVDRINDIAKYLYQFGTPVYNINLKQVGKFNRKFNNKYNVEMTFEESKIYFIVINNLTTFNTTLDLSRKIYFWRSRDRIVVIVKHGYNSRFYNTIKSNFLHSFEHRIVNIVFVFLSNSDAGDAIIQSYTYNQFTQNYLIYLDNNMFNIFPDKVANLNGFPIRISMFDNIVDAIPGNNMFMGRDGLMSSSIMDYINATAVYAYPKGHVNYGLNYNRTYTTGTLDDVRNHVTDVAFNTRFLRLEFDNYVEGTYPHDRDDLSCLIPRQDHEDVKSFAVPLPLPVWMVSMLVLILFYLYIIICSKRHRDNHVAVIDALFISSLIMLGKPIKELNIKYFRLAFLSYLTFSFFLLTVYQSKLTSVMTVKTKPIKIDTLEQLAETDFVIVTLRRYKVMLNVTLEPRIRNKIIPRIRTIPEEKLIAEIRKQKNQVIICKNHLARYGVAQKSNYQENGKFYRIMKESPFPSLCSYIVSYGSPFHAKFNVLIHRIVESGIQGFWKREIWHYLSVSGTLRVKRNHQKKKLSAMNLLSAFRTFMAGAIVSTLVFLVEVCRS